MATDRISYLPQDIQHKILSFLPTEEAAMTNTLSKQWRKVFYSLSTFEFNQMHLQFLDHHGNPSALRFREFISNTLVNHCDSDIQNLKIHTVVDQDNLEAIYAWITIAVAYNVSRLELVLYSDGHKFSNVPNCLFSCKTLTELTLRDFTLTLPASLGFPSVKCLTLMWIEFTNDQSEVSTRFFPSFPVLEYLKVMHSFSGYNKLMISTPNLKILEMDSSPVSGNIIVSSTTLNQISYNDDPLYLKGDRILFTQFIETPFLNVRKASFTFVRPPYLKYKFAKKVAANGALKILVELKNVVELAMLGNFVQYLIREPNAPYELPASSGSVKHLQLEGSVVEYEDVIVIMFLLTTYPEIQTLKIISGSSSYFNNNELDIEYLGNLPRNARLDSLRTIEITGFGQTDCEFQLVEYFLGEARVMENMNIIVREHTSVSEVTERINTFYKAASDVAISISQMIT